MTTTPGDCPLCTQDGGVLLWANGDMRVVHVPDPQHPGYTRVIWNRHVAEMTQLSPQHRDALMQAVWTVEQAQRHTLQPDKVNLAQFGNMVPHLHWHVIPRWSCDPRFPDAVWAPPPPRSAEREAAWQALAIRIQARMPHYHEALRAALGEM